MVVEDMLNNTVLLLRRHKYEGRHQLAGGMRIDAVKKKKNTGSEETKSPEGMRPKRGIKKSKCGRLVKL